MFFKISQDTRLHASFENELVQKHKHLLNKGQGLSINAFSPKEQGGQCMNNSFPYKLAILKENQDKNIDWFPNDVLEKYFTDFGEVLDEKYEQNILKVKNILIGKKHIDR